MTTSHADITSRAPNGAPSGAPRGAPALPAFRTPVRGHAYAPRPDDAPPPHPGQPARLVPEPANPADPHAIAVWVDDDLRRWRIGYLDRGVAARVAPRLRDGLTLTARVDGWVQEPEGRWKRPVVHLLPEQPPARPNGVWGRPPGVSRRRISGSRAR
jgi:hypothetical protein